MIDLRQGDCLEVMASIPDGSIDLVLADLPFGTTACRWDQVIPFEPLWEHYKRLIKPRGAVVLTASQPFTSMLVMSNKEWFKYCLVCEKTGRGNHLSAPYQPLKCHEDICVFSPAASTYSPCGTMKYNPQFTYSEPYSRSPGGEAKWIFRSPVVRPACSSPDGRRYPVSIIRMSNASQFERLHHTQKSVDLMEYLIKTYSNEGDTVLDNTMGSGTTGVACLNTGRDFIGIEKDPEIYVVAERRIAAELARTALLDGVAVLNPAS